MSGYTQSSGSIIDYVILRIFVLLALPIICWSWSLNREECEAKRAFDSQSHQFDRGGIYNDLGDSRKLLLLLLSGRNMGYGNDNIIISGLSDNTGSVDNIITDDNSMGDIDWYYYYDLQDGELEIDSHDHSATFTPGALISSTPKLWVPSTLLHIGNYDAMTIRPPRYLPTVIPSYTHGCHYFMCPILLSTRHESQYVHKCHRCHLMSNNGEWSDRVSDTHEDNDHLYDHMAGYYAYPSAGVPEDVLATIIYQSSKRGDDLDASTTAGEMPEQVTNVSGCTLWDADVNSWPILCFFGIDNVSAIFYDGNVPSSQMVRKYGESSCILSHKQEGVCTTSLFITGVKVLDINFLGLSHGKKVFIITVQSHHLVLHQLCRLVCLVRCEVNGESSAFDWSQFIPYIGIIIGHTTTSWGANTCETSYVGYFFMSRENEELVSCSIKPKEHGAHNACVHCVVVLKEHGESAVCLIHTQHPPHLEVALQLGFSTSSAPHTTHITSTNIVNPWGALVHVLRSSAYTRPTDTLPLNMHSCRCSYQVMGEIFRGQCLRIWRDATNKHVPLRMN